MKPVRKRQRELRQAALFGVGLDNQDGHKRITTGEKFIILGGSAETHERMTETIVKTFSREAFLRPTRETVTVYGPPTRTLGITKRPFSRVAVP